MLQIKSITSDPRQSHILTIEGQADCTMTLEWRDTQSSWFASFSWGSWSCKNMRVCMCPNILTQFSNVLPFGIAILSENGQDPMTIDAFSKLTTGFYILSASEVADLVKIYG
jgi:hypothetical protein